MTARPWTSRHRDALLSRVTFLTAGTAVVGTVGAVGLGVALAATSHPKPAVAWTTGPAAPTVPDVATPDAGPTPAPTPSAAATRAARSTVRTVSSARSTTAKAAPTRTKAKATPRPTRTKAWTPPPAPPQPTSRPSATASGGS